MSKSTRLIRTLCRKGDLAITLVLALLLIRTNRYLRRDPWTACPVLAKTSGPPVADFLDQNGAAMCSTPLDIVSSRILASNRPLIYQWALHIISGLSFIHAHNIVFSDLDLEQCWLSLDSHLYLSLVGFVHAGFWQSTDGAWYDGRQSNAAWFHPLEHTKATTQTDLFLYGCVVYQLMTGAWPGDRLTDKTGPEVRMIIPRKDLREQDIFRYLLPNTRDLV
jgi:serine/threonine protein kinase